MGSLAAVSHVRSDKPSNGRRAGALRAAASVCAGLALVYLAVSTGGQRSQLAERQTMGAVRSAQLQQVRAVAPAQTAQAKLTQEIRNAAEMHAAQAIRTMEAASAAKAAPVAPAVSPAVEKRLGSNMPAHGGVTDAQRAIEQREVAEEERENEGSTESVLPDASHKFAHRMVRQQVPHPVFAAPRPVYAARATTPLKPAVKVAPQVDTAAARNTAAIYNNMLAKAKAQMVRGESSFNKKMRSTEKNSHGLSPHEMEMERKESEEDEAQNEGATTSVMVTGRQEEAEEEHAKDKLEARNAAFHQQVAEEKKNERTSDKEEDAYWKKKQMDARSTKKAGVKTAPAKLAAPAAAMSSLSAFKKVATVNTKNLNMLVAAKKQQQKIESHIQAEINAIEGPAAPPVASKAVAPKVMAVAKSAREVNSEEEAVALHRAKEHKNIHATHSAREVKQAYMTAEQKSLHEVAAMDNAKWARQAASPKVPNPETRNPK